MKRLTKEKALEFTAKLWDWIAKEGKYKHNWPEWETSDYDDDPFCNHFFLCAYSRENPNPITPGVPLQCNCPLWGQWEGDTGGCMGNGALYERWSNYKPSSSEARAIAQRIADICWEELVRMEKQK